jgi:rhamnosyltransferase
MRRAAYSAFSAAIPPRVWNPPVTSPYLCSVVIPTKNGGELFKDVVRGLAAQTCWPRVEFIVIDSGSQDDTVPIAQAAGARVIAIAPQDFNHGATRDAAIAAAAGDRIVLLVQDAVLADTHLIETLLAALSEDVVAGVYARQIPRATADVITRRNLADHFTGGSRRVVQSLDDPSTYDVMAPADKRALCNFDNVCSAIRKDVWQRVPFGRTDFGEDIAWAERVLKLGYRIVYEPAAVVIHSHDRPLGYEYARAYVCHRMLYRQFGLSQVPSVGIAVAAWLRATLRDAVTILRDERRPWTMLTLLLKTPLVNVALIRAKYRAEQDERRGLPSAVAGV